MYKKIVLFIGIISISSNASAISTDNISKIEYKWYKEELKEELYYPKKDNLSGYLENENNIKYGDYSKWDKQYCSYQEDYYNKEEKVITKYEKIINTRYIKLELIHNIGTYADFKVIKVFNESEELNYHIIQNDNYGIKLDLGKEYNTEKLHFYIDIDVKYFIFLSNNIEMTKISINSSVIPRYDGKDVYPNENWITNNSTFVSEESESLIENSIFIKNIIKENLCRVQEIYTYRYKTERKYYDDNHHVFIDGYLPDIKTAIIYYKDKQTPLSIPETQKENIEHIEKTEQINTQKNIPVEVEKTIYVPKYINKEIIKIPLKIYLILIILLIIIILETKIILSKKVDWNNYLCLSKKYKKIKVYAKLK